MTEDLPPDEEQVRRLLAASAAVPPMPPPVAAHLEGVLASLVDEQKSGPTRAPATLEDRRRARPRRWAPLALVAAAAVAVVGVGLGANGLLSTDGGSDSASDEAAGQAAKGSAEAVPSLHSATLGVDVRRTARRGTASEGGDASRLSGRSTRGERTSLGCLVPGHESEARVVAVRLDGRAATLVLPGSSTGMALVYACDDVATPLARARLGG